MKDDGTSRRPAVTSDGSPTRGNSQERVGFTIAAIAAGLVFVASGTNFLRYHDYPLLLPEVGWFAAMLGAAGIMFALLYSIRVRYWKACLEASLIFLAIDLNADYLPAAAIAAGSALIFIVVTKISLLPALGVMWGVILLTSLVGVVGTQAFLKEERRPAPTRVTQLPAILHLILDEHIGVEGLPLSNPKSSQAKNELNELLPVSWTPR